MTPIYPWQPWPGRWPASRDEEQALVADLEERTGKTKAKYDRGDVTTLMNLLRCGITFEALLEEAPGVKPERLLAAYRNLDQRRRAADEAWQAIVANPTMDQLTHHGPEAAKLLPIPVYRLVTTGRTTAGASLKVATAKTTARIRNVTEKVGQVEAVLASGTLAHDTAAEVGRTLYDPSDPGLWGDPMFLPSRVGQLMPMKVRDLLGRRK